MNKKKKSFIITMALAGAAFSAFVLDVSPVSVAGHVETLPTPKPQSVAHLTFTEGEFDGKTVVKSEEEWKRLLTGDEFHILREEGTERPYTGSLLNNKKVGTYHCAACGLVLFKSSTKYDSQTGWPSFYQPFSKKNVTEKSDKTLGEERIEVECARCGGHLGHVFDDGPQPTGLRYCMNSVSLKFKAAK